MPLLVLAGSGKSAVCRTLQLAESSLAIADAAASAQQAAAACGSAQKPLEAPGAGDAGDAGDAAATPDQAAQTPATLSPGVHAHVLNPKSISLAELYGSHNAVTSEWSDGLASRLVRAAVADKSGRDVMHWVVFDGPVTTDWVESMNTGEGGKLGFSSACTCRLWLAVRECGGRWACSVRTLTPLPCPPPLACLQPSWRTALDDNRMLCLPNGERIKLDESRLRLLFEVQDLAFASPATVSRCGLCRQGCRAANRPGGR
jgi:hypothetical protein